MITLVFLFLPSSLIYSTTLAPPSSSSTGGVFSSVWNLRSTVKHFQNLLDGYLSYAESWKNLLNWTHPQKVWFGTLTLTLILTNECFLY